MIIIQLKGGLGNQMFQYALYLQLKNLGREVKIDDETGFIDDKLRIPVLDRFGIEYERATKDEVIQITDSKMDLWSRIRRKITGRRTFRIDEESGIFDPRILEKENAYLVGYWQSDKYFPDEDVIASIKDAFEKRPQEIMKDSVSWTTLQQIECCESVSLHVRRTDYIDAEHIHIHNICTEKYYKSAIDKIRNQYPGAVFFIFTDDKEWCKQHFRGPNFFVVELDENANTDIAEMTLMSRCKHHIIANSSFSWWAAWLNDNPNKIVIAPEKWINDRAMDDIYTARMTKIAI
ncbi:alpha-1,2-fucosyltransferase [Butyrivibrio sp. YAB3001]|uniref:alpha-1,2-fucosyltransferase n=1 Tax=Butyrivibrio sp. YAB3001 TaxID=1520812 RepID=UPI0008F632A5|nr:alpha-1,2-fucosyltransferase [Butyrivibrio sp. YAB3001]SFC76927.1 Glycosyl transferase family 11 [Butyrivibrio sp. YAB3001]